MTTLKLLLGIFLACFSKPELQMKGWRILVENNATDHWLTRMQTFIFAKRYAVQMGNENSPTSHLSWVRLLTHSRAARKAKNEIKRVVFQGTPKSAGEALSILCLAREVDFDLLPRFSELCALNDMYINYEICSALEVLGSEAGEVGERILEKCVNSVTYLDCGKAHQAMAAVYPVSVSLVQRLFQSARNVTDQVPGMLLHVRHGALPGLLDIKLRSTDPEILKTIHAEANIALLQTQWDEISLRYLTILADLPLSPKQKAFLQSMGHPI